MRIEGGFSTQCRQYSRSSSGSELSVTGSQFRAQMSKATFELYVDSADQWRWRLRHRNTEIIADGGEGYSTKQAARNGIESVKRNAAAAPITDVDHRTTEEG